MEFVFTGIPTRKEILLHLKIARTYRIKKKTETLFDKINNKSLTAYINMLIYKNKISRQVAALIMDHAKRYRYFVDWVFNKKQVSRFELMYKRRNPNFIEYAQKFSVFNEIHKYDIETNKLNCNALQNDTQVLTNLPAIVQSEFFETSFKPPVRYKNLKFLTEGSNQKFIDLNLFIPKKHEVLTNKINFNYISVNEKIKNERVLTEVSQNIPKVFKKTRIKEKDYKKILQKNTQINSVYRNVKVFFTNNNTKTKQNIKNNRERSVKWVDDIEPEVHNKDEPVPILKSNRIVCKKKQQKKMKEIVFVQNIFG